MYIETDEEKRWERALIGPEEFVRQDSLKRARGVELIHLNADLLLYNNGTVADSMHSLLSFARNTGIDCGAPVAPEKQTFAH